MQTARVTVLMTPEKKAAIEADASRLGVSSGEYIRLAVDNYHTPEEEAELALLVGQVNAALPLMTASLDRSVDALEQAHRQVDDILRQMGARA